MADMASQSTSKTEAKQQPQQSSSGSGGWSSWYGVLSQTVASVRKDLDEFVGTIQGDTAATVKRTTEEIRARKEGEQPLNAAIHGLRTTVSRTLAAAAEDDGITSPPRASSTELARSRSSGAVSGAASEAAVHADALRRLLLHEPTDLDDFEAWRSGFDVHEHTEEVSKLLASDEVLRGLHAQLIPIKVSYENFWQRYFYQLHAKKVQEEKRTALMQRMQASAYEEQEEELAWDDDDDEEEGEPQGGGSGALLEESATNETASQVAEVTATAEEEVEEARETGRPSGEDARATREQETSAPASPPPELAPVVAETLAAPATIPDTEPPAALLFPDVQGGAAPCGEAYQVEPLKSPEKELREAFEPWSSEDDEAQPQGEQQEPQQTSPEETLAAAADSPKGAGPGPGPAGDTEFSWDDNLDDDDDDGEGLAQDDDASLGGSSAPLETDGGTDIDGGDDGWEDWD